MGIRDRVIAGAGSNDTSYAVEFAREAKKAGVDALLAVTPYYNKTSQAGLIRHYNVMADATDPVSYTHLDVYKRQAEKLTPTASASMLVATDCSSSILNVSVKHFTSSFSVSASYRIFPPINTSRMRAIQWSKVLLYTENAEAAK